MGPTWVRQDPCGPHVGHVNLAIWDYIRTVRSNAINALSLRPRNTYMRHQSRPSLVQIMTCRLFGTKPLSEPMLDFCRLVHRMGTYFSEIWNKTQPFSLMKISEKFWPSFLGLNVLTWQNANVMYRVKKFGTPYPFGKYFVQDFCLHWPLEDVAAILKLWICFTDITD